MKVLYITNMFPYEGNEAYGVFVKEQIDAINQHHRIDYDLFVIRGWENKLNYFKSIFAIRNQIRLGNYDFIHIHFGLSGLFLLFYQPPIPVVLTLHGSDIQSGQKKYLQIITKWVLRKASKIIVVNSNMVNIVKNITTNVEIIPCSVNMQLFCPNDNLEKKSDSDKVYNIIFPSSRKRYIKNYPLFEKVCSILRDKNKLKIRCHYLEGMSRLEVANLYKKSDLMILTSISEGSPQVVKEAMACNLSVVSTNVGDVKVLLDGVRSCYVSEEFDALQLANLSYTSLTQVNNGFSPREKIIQLGLDDETIARKIFKLYEQLV